MWNPSNKNNMKKLFTLFLLALLPILAFADAVEINGIYYYLDSESNEAGVTENPNEYSGKVVIPKTVTYQSVVYKVTTIYPSAFYECSSLTSVTIPTSVTEIGGLAFYGCSGLTSITILKA
jgi:hypothetical protein